MSNDKKDLKYIFNKFVDGKDLTQVGNKPIGIGAYGEVREIIFRNKKMAGKLEIKKNNKEEKSEEEKLMVELRGQNIIKIHKIYSKAIDAQYYNLIIMDKAQLNDMQILTDYYYKRNLLKLLFDPFEQKVGDSLLRFYSRQIINALQTLDNNYCVHYDLKPENLLILLNLIVKLSDFSLLRKVKGEKDKTKIPGGTTGFLSPEYYVDENVTGDVARKQDYFALGSTLFYLKYGEKMIKFNKSNDNLINEDKVINSLQYQISFIKSRKLVDKDFIDFLTSLISYNPNDRPSFVQIYTNKWLNKDVDYIDNIIANFENEEEKVLMELQKVDFLIEDEKRQNDKSIKKNKERDIKSYRFLFKKRKK